MGNHGNSNNNNNEAVEAMQCSLFVLTTTGPNKAPVIVITILATISVLTINFMLIYGTIVTTKRNHYNKPFTITQRLFIYMSINDIITIILFMTKMILDEFGTRIPCFLVIALICLLDGTFLLSSLLFFILSVLRYRAIRNPFLTTSTRSVIGLCIGSIILSMVFCGILVYANISMSSPEIFQKVMCFISFALFLFIDFVLIVNTLSYLQLVKSSTPITCLLYTSPSPRDKRQSRMPSSA